MGDLGNITADTAGRALFRFQNNDLKVTDIIGRSLVVTENADDLGRGQNSNSKIDGNSGLKYFFILNEMTICMVVIKY